MESKILFLLIIFEYISLSNCYNNSKLKNVTANDLKNYSRENGYEGCLALYDSGANETETCTQFKLEDPYICCKVHYKLGDFENDFCMPIANNKKAIKDVKTSFKNADEVEILCQSLFYKLSSYLLLLLLIIIV